jgi:Ca-activated chloride channel family protein
MTPANDETEMLRRRLAADPPPPPRAEARARALAAALDAFDAAHSTNPATTPEAGSLPPPSWGRAGEGGLRATTPAATPPTGGWAADGVAPAGRRQGNPAGPRPRQRRHSRLPLLGRLRMTHLPSARALMLGSASLAVLTLAVITSTELIERDGPALRLPAPSRLEARDDERARQAEAPAEQPAAAQDTSQETDPDAAPTAGAQGYGGIAASPPPAPLPAPLAVRRAPAAKSESLAGLTGAAPSPTLAQPAPAADAAAPAWREQGRDRFADIQPNGVKVTAEEPVSTFSVDVDTASYSFVRGALMQGALPPKDTVRIEELINYFPYDYAPPTSRETPFATHVAIMPTPWNPETRLMRIGIEGYALAPAERPRANLVFLIDTSGSMDAPDKLPLLVNSFRLLVERLAPEDKVAIVTYAGSAGTVLEPTPASDKARILGALERLHAGGSTAGAEGIRQAYQLARANLDPDGVNRVILATDGDFNVGIASTDELQDFVERQRDGDVFLSVLGFGRGNLNDELMQALAQNGNGQAAYIDTLSEARKVLVEEASSTLFPIAKDVKIQVEFNPATVAEYRLIGYETRLLDREDFNNDRVDAGEIGAGHSVTALYEITPAGSAARAVEPLRYGAAPAADGTSDEYAFVRIRYKLPDEDASRLIERPVTAADQGPGDTDARFAAAVAAFGQLLHGGEHMGDFGYDDVVALASAAKGDDPFGYRAEFVTLARLAASAAAMEPQ